MKALPILLGLLCCLFHLPQLSANNAVVANSEERVVCIETLYGCEAIVDPVILDLLEAPIMQRLRGVDQSGIGHYFGLIPAYHRYQHSVGVYQLLKRFGLSRQEQIAGLLHDASHTVFSHTGDWLFNEGNHQIAYQDTIHAWFLKQQNLMPLLEQHGIAFEDLLPDRNAYMGLDQELPDFCVDRLEYNLFTGHLLGMLTPTEVDLILLDVHFDGSHWYFNTPAVAAKFASISLYLTEHLFTEPTNVILNELTAKALKRALRLNEITIEQIHFGTDIEVLGALQTSTDQTIQSLMHACANIHTSFAPCEPNQADYNFRGKFRGVDPLICLDGTFVRLTSVHQPFALEYQRVKEKVAKGISVCWLLPICHTD